MPVCGSLAVSECQAAASAFAVEKLLKDQLGSLRPTPLNGTSELTFRAKKLTTSL